MVRTLPVIICFVSLAATAFGQKVKYKDLFVLLNAKQYDQAEPFLRKYLAENDDNPNAYLFMGIIFQEKASHNDVLKHTDIMLGNIDSAIYYYDKAYQQVDEKEVRRNDEYYQAYNRRDLRTGKFGVKLSDVQFDLEKKMQALKERKVLVRELKTHYNNAESLYAKAQFLFKDIQLKYGSEKALFLRSDESTIQDLNRIAHTFDSCMLSFKSYKDVLSAYGNSGHNQEVALMEIGNLEKDGTTPADFMQDKITLWDYKKWAENSISGIEKEIVPMRENLIAYDIAINKLREKLKKDSVSVKNDLTKLVDKILYDQLGKYDPDPLPMDIFGMKIAELGYLSELINNKPLRDSASVKLKLEMVEKELKEINSLDSIATKLEARDMEADVLDYAHFVKNAYGTPAVVKSLVKTTKDFADREKERKTAVFAQLKESLRWMVVEADSIPLFMEVPKSSPYKPLLLVEDKYTAGFQFSDSVATGYFSTIAPSRKGGIKVVFPVDNKVFNRKNLPITKALSASDENGQVFYILFYSEGKVNEKFPATLAKIYRTDGLAWSHDFSYGLLPVEVTFQVESGEVAIKTSNPAGESKMVFIDKNGKPKATHNEG